jgi:nitrile hydratase
MEGFGPIPLDDDHEPVEADWQARFLALTSALRGPDGLFDTDEVRDAVERLDPVTYLTAPYWEKMIAAFEMVLVDKGVVQPDELTEPSGDDDAHDAEHHREHDGDPHDRGDHGDQTHG